MNVLIVDDSVDSAQTLAKLLEVAGHTSAIASNGKEALASVIASLPDVIVLDLIMPEMDGANFLEVVRSYLRLQPLPVVVVTGAPDSPMVDRVQALKVNSVLLKGKASPEEIVKAIEEAATRAPG